MSFEGPLRRLAWFRAERERRLLLFAIGTANEAVNIERREFSELVVETLEGDSRSDPTLPAPHFVYDFHGESPNADMPSCYGIPLNVDFRRMR